MKCSAFIYLWIVAILIFSYILFLSWLAASELNSFGATIFKVFFAVIFYPHFISMFLTPPTLQKLV